MEVEADEEIDTAYSAVLEDGRGNRSEAVLLGADRHGGPGVPGAGRRLDRQPPSSAFRAAFFAASRPGPRPGRSIP